MAQTVNSFFSSFNFAGLVNRSGIVLFFLLGTCQVFGQDISGFWKGTLTIPGGCFPQNFIELQLTVDGNTVRGDSYHYLDRNNFIKKKCTGSWSPETKTLVVQEEYVVERKVPENCSICIKKYVFAYRKDGDREWLEGGWTGTVTEIGAVCQPGTITLSRIKESFFKEEQVQEVYVDTGSLHLAFYDNSIIDGDSITILVNKKVVKSHQLLGLKPIEMDVVIDLGNRMQEVEMVAENLGSIPPNTALLVVSTPKDQYRLYLTSTEQKSAKVRFIYAPPDKPQL